QAPEPTGYGPLQSGGLHYPDSAGHECERDWSRPGSGSGYVKTGDFAGLPDWVHLLGRAERLYRSVLGWTSQRQKTTVHQPGANCYFSDAVDLGDRAAMPAGNEFA